MRRERLPLWALLSFVAVLGVAVSALLAQAARNTVLDGVVDRARDAQQLLTDAIPDKELAEPIKGASYDKLAKKMSRSVSADGSSVGVTVWSSRGRVVFSLDRPSVGTSDREMRPLIQDMAEGSGSYRIAGTTVRAFVPVPRIAKGPVVVVEVDEPLAAVESRVGNSWTLLRLAFGVALAVSLLLLGLTFVSSLKRTRARENVAEDQAPHDGEAVGATTAEPAVDHRATEQPVTEAAAPPPSESEPSETEPSEPEPSESEPTETEPSATQPAATDQPVTERPTASFTQALEALQALQPDLEHAIHQDEVSHDGVTAAKNEVSREGAAVPEDGAAHQAAAKDEAREDAAGTDEAPDAERAAQELLRKRREEFKARAAKAELRVKKQEIELQQAGSGPRSEQ